MQLRLKDNKYKNKKVVVDGVNFDSKKEAQRYTQLKMLEKAGIIKSLKLQPAFELQPTFKKNGITHRAIKYVADFAYVDVESNKLIVEDVKSDFTKENPVFKLKKKMFEFKYHDLELNEIIL